MRLLLAEAQLHMEVLQEKARVTGLEVQVRALCFELARARENAGIFHAWVEDPPWSPAGWIVLTCHHVQVVFGLCSRAIFAAHGCAEPSAVYGLAANIMVQASFNAKWPQLVARHAVVY